MIHQCNASLFRMISFVLFISCFCCIVFYPNVFVSRKTTTERIFMKSLSENVSLNFGSHLDRLGGGLHSPSVLIHLCIFGGSLA